MELKFKGDGDRPKLPTLRQLLAEIAEAEQHPDVLPYTARRGKSSITFVPPRPISTFMYDGYVYAIVNGVGCNLSMSVQPGFHACMNLRSQTVRAIPLDKIVDPIPVEVHVPADKTHRYNHV